MEIKEGFTREQIQQAIKEVARYDYKYKNKYLKLEYDLTFTPTQEETEQYEKNLEILKINKVFDDNLCFCQMGSWDEKIYDQFYNLGEKQPRVDETTNKIVYP